MILARSFLNRFVPRQSSGMTFNLNKSLCFNLKIYIICIHCQFCTCSRISRFCKWIDFDHALRERRLRIAVFGTVHAECMIGFTQTRGHFISGKLDRHQLRTFTGPSPEGIGAWCFRGLSRVFRSLLINEATMVASFSTIQVFTGHFCWYNRDVFVYCLFATWIWFARTTKR